MRISEAWIREWVDPKLDSSELAHQLTMLGHEVDSIERYGEGLDGVLIGEVLSVDPHPDADRLKVCKVKTGEGDPVEIVCGAPNVRAGMKSPLAVPGVTLPGGLKLRKTKIRGVTSNGMLCSAAELGLGDDADGILELPAGAVTGAPLADYLKLPDTIIEVDLTPNRGDCFSLLGLARDLSALTGAPLKAAPMEPVKPTIDDRHEVRVEDARLCPSFCGRVIRGIDPAARTPLWMSEKLRRAGLRPIHPVVDVTNYVMLELGQPCHAYDLDLLQGAVRPRLAKAGESVELLDNRTVTPDGSTVVIADDSGVIGLAGIMGGATTAVSDETVNVFFEAAWWPPSIMAGRARSYGLHTDASLRFERGVDPVGQVRAVEFATALILQICGGAAGPTQNVVDTALLPERKPIRLRRQRLERVLGVAIEDARVTRILEGLSLDVAADDSGWLAVAPSHRFDLSIEADLIEEVARIHGYDEIPETTATAESVLAPSSESNIDPNNAAQLLVARDYQEVITYSFIDARHDALFAEHPSKLVLSNPISSEMSVMRASLWPGMLAAASANLARQQDRVRFFELGKSFHGELDEPVETLRLAGIATGARFPEQWSETARPVDFFDIKSDVEALAAATGATDDFEFVPAEKTALQPGQTAAILRDGHEVGVIGKLHPRVARDFDIRKDVFLFELDVDGFFASSAPVAAAVSRYPSIRRDIAIVVDQAVSSASLVDCVRRSAPGLIKAVRIFDIYTGGAIEAGRKSVALGLILQETSRTLTDEDADSATARAVQILQQEYAAELRE